MYKNKFESLEDCYFHLLDKYVLKNPEKKIYLYPGEAGNYPTTFTSRERITNKSTFLMFQTMQENLITKIIESVPYWDMIYSECSTQDEKEHIKDIIRSYLQHYDYPTYFVDFTLDLDIAIFFASNTLTITDGNNFGRICVAEYNSILSHNFNIFPITYDYWDKPKRKYGYVIDLY